MNLIVIAACIATCWAAKLERTYLPPDSANTAGGTAEFLQTPFNRASIESIPAGGYVNENEGVVIDTSTGTRATGPSGLGGPRISYGSTNSKVGDSAFKDTTKENLPNSRPVIGTIPNVAGFRQPLNPMVSGMANNYQHDLNSPSLVQERFQASRDRGSNIVRYQNDIGTKDFNYVFETDNGISAGGNGIATNGVRTQGGYSYTGDDGQVYSVSYVADEGGYRPIGDHLPTPPPIPLEILRSLEQNAKDEAAGIHDDGSYDAEKYNKNDYTKGITANDRYNERQSNRYNGGLLNNAITSSINEKDNNQTFINPDFSTQNQALKNPSYNKEQLSQFDNSKYNKDKTMNTNNIANSLSHNQFDSFTSNVGPNNGIISSVSTSNIPNVESSPNSNYKPFTFTENNKLSVSIPLSQQNLQDQKENENSLFGRPSSYDAPITGNIQVQQPLNIDGGNNLVFNRFDGSPTISEKQNGFSAEAFNNQDIIPQPLEVNKNPVSTSSKPSDSSLSYTNSFMKNPANQHSQQFRPEPQLLSSASKLSNHNRNINQNDMNKISDVSYSQQKNENNLQSNTFFSEKQNTVTGNSLLNNYDQNAFGPIVNQNNNINDVSTTLRPISFNRYSQGLNNNNYYNQPIPSSPIPTFPATISTPINFPVISQQMSQIMDDRYPKPMTPSKTLSTPKEDKPQSEQETSPGLTQASISAFPSVVSIASHFNKPFNAFESSKLQNNNVNSLDSISQKVNQHSLFSGSSSGISAAPNQYQSEVYEYQRPAQSLSTSTERPNFSNQLSSAFNQQTGSNVQSTQQNYNKQDQQSTLQSTMPQTQGSFFIHNTQSKIVTQFDSKLSTNKTLEEDKNGLSNRPQNNNMFRPQLLPSRPPFSLQNGCCLDSTSLNKKDSNFGSNNYNMNIVNNGGNVFGDKTASSATNQKVITGNHSSQAYDETGYHY